MSTFFTLGLVFSWTLAVQAASSTSNVLFEQSNAEGTLYYDYGGKGAQCHNILGADAGPQMLDNQPLGCTYHMPEGQGIKLGALHTNRIVAINENLMKADLTRFCGKEVKVFRPDGSEVTIDEGPFVLFDFCRQCAIQTRIDFSAIGHMAASGKPNCDANPPGLKFQVLDNQIYGMPTDGTWTAEMILAGASGGTSGTNSTQEGPSSASSAASTASIATATNVGSGGDGGGSGSGSTNPGSSGPDLPGSGQPTLIPQNAFAKNVDATVTVTETTYDGVNPTGTPASDDSDDCEDEDTPTSTATTSPVATTDTGTSTTLATSPDDDCEEEDTPTSTTPPVATTDTGNSTTLATSSDDECEDEDVSTPSSSAPSPSPTGSLDDEDCEDDAPTSPNTGSTASASSGDDCEEGGGVACTYGAYKCSGNDLQRCVYNHPGTLDLEWVTSNKCPTICKTDGSTTVSCY